MLGSIGKQSGESVESVLKIGGKKNVVFVNVTGWHIGTLPISLSHAA